MSKCSFEVVYCPRFVAWSKPGLNWMAVGSGETRKECERVLVGRTNPLVLPYGQHPLEALPCSRD